VCKPILSWDDDNIDSVLSPHEVSLMETVDLRKKEGTGLLLLSHGRKKESVSFYSIVHRRPVG
jgi:hypothetical protein